MRVVASERGVFVENVAGWDAALRVLVGLAILVAAFGSLYLFDADWAFTLIIHPFILAVYFLATGVSRMEPVYHAFGWRTLRADEDRRLQRSVRSRRSRGPRRTSP